jgi:hypothetical protein
MIDDLDLSFSTFGAGGAGFDDLPPNSSLENVLCSFSFAK